MNMLVRWGKFNVVGAMGVAVQLGTLAAVNRWTGGHYLVASAVAIEVAVLHNFVWHVRYTWRDRADEARGLARLGQLLRFQLSNGAVSLLGNLGLMRLLIHAAHWPLLAANGTAILCCSVLNFLVGNVWAFARPAPQSARQFGWGFKEGHG